MSTVKLHDIYCPEVGPTKESGQIRAEHTVCDADMRLIVGRYDAPPYGKPIPLKVGFGSSPDVHGGELAALDLGHGVRRPLRCVCGKPMRFRVAQEIDVELLHRRRTATELH